MELQLDVSTCPGCLHVSPGQHTGRERATQETRGTGTHTQLFVCPHTCPFARRPEPPIGGSCRSRRGSLTLRAPTWGAASRRPGPTMRLGGKLRRYSPLTSIWEGRAPILAQAASSVYGGRPVTFSVTLPSGSCLSFLLTLHFFTLLPPFSLCR